MSTKNKILVALILLMVGVFFVLAYLIYKAEQNPTSTSVPSTKDVKNYPEDLKGKVYLTLKEKEESEGVNTRRIFSFDFEKDNFKRESFYDKIPTLGGEIDRQGDKMLISMFFPQQIYIANKNRQVAQITNSPNKFKKEAVWSTDNQKIAFMSSKEVSGEFPAFDINSWDIVVSDLDGNENKISTGVHPFFSPDDKKILFLKENGLNLIDLETRKEKNVLNFEADPAFQLDLSFEKNRLVVSNPLKKTITVYEIASWDDFQLEKFHEIENPQAFNISWPKLSPYDGKYLIYEELSEDGTIQLVAYDIKNSKKHFILDLSSYEHGFMWINDWR